MPNRSLPLAHTSIQATVVRLEAAQASRGMERTEPNPVPERPGNRVVFVIGCTLLLLVAYGVAILGTARGASGGCALIGYAITGSAPPYLRTELDVAVQEIHRHTGLSFEPRSLKAANLVVRWSSTGVTVAEPTPALSGSEGNRVLGFGAGRWRGRPGDRRLVEGVIELNASKSWTLGLQQGNGLAAVLVHELGHVVGLHHSTDPASFMHDRVSPGIPRWTADDLDQLAEAGRDAACGPHVAANP